MNFVSLNRKTKQTRPIRVMAKMLIFITTPKGPNLSLSHTEDIEKIDKIFRISGNRVEIVTLNGKN